MDSFILRLNVFNLVEYQINTMKVVSIDIVNYVFRMCVWMADGSVCSGQLIPNT